MKVLIDTTALGRGPSGTATYIRSLMAALRDMGGIDVAEAGAPPRRRGGEKGARGLTGAARSAANLAAERRWLARGLPQAAADAGAHLVHHPLPALMPRYAGPQAITVHDLAFERLPWAFDPAWRTMARVTHRRAALRADTVICVSGTTATDARALWGVDANRIVVAPHGAPAGRLGGRGPGSPPAAPFGGVPLEGNPAPSPPKPFALYVGDDEPRKNVDTLLEAWRIRTTESSGVDLDLVLAGGAAVRAGGDGSIIGIERPDDAELDALYSEASVLIHPSLHEGFGMTTLEAMARGTPVLAARAAGVTEVCGDAASYFDPRDPRDLARRLSELIADGDRLSELAAAGARRAASRTWARTAELHVEAYEMAIRAAESGAGR